MQYQHHIIWNLDEIEFLLCNDHDSPGLLLKKGGHVVWTPIAARTKSRISYRDRVSQLADVGFVEGGFSYNIAREARAKI